MGSDAMLPTIENGAHIKIKKNIDPLTYGDLIIFNYTGSGDFAIIDGPVVYRIVALPGDSIAIEKDICIINGKKNSYQFIQKSIGYNNEYEERLPNDLTIRIYSEAYHPESPNMDIEATKVPENHYYVMGDNRTNAIYSRYLGCIPKEKILGKVIEIKK
jgi:signal peptidase I